MRYADVSYEYVPEGLMRERLRGYVERGESVGGFLTALLCNDLVGAFRKADEGNRARMHDYAAWLWNEAPGDSWGSPEKVARWQGRGGLRGTEAAEAERQADDLAEGAAAEADPTEP